MFLDLNQCKKMDGHEGMALNLSACSMEPHVHLCFVLNPSTGWQIINISVNLYVLIFNV